MERSFFPGKEDDQVSLRFLRSRYFPMLISLAEQFGHLGLRVHRRAIVPAEWASYHVLLAQLLVVKQYGNQPQNLEDAISHLSQALEVYSPDFYPHKWAEVLQFLGVFYLVRIRGDRAENVEQTRQCYEQALMVVSPDTAASNYAALIHGLGDVYANRLRGSRAENLEQAITLYTQAGAQLAAVPKTSTWYLSRSTVVNQSHWSLARAYLERVVGDKAENIEQALEHYQQALTGITRDNRPALWSKLIGELGYACLVRIQGDKSENLEQAITWCRNALSIQEVTKANLPAQWATVLATLAETYAERIKGTPEENLQQALAYYQQALEVRTPERLPVECRQTAYALGRQYYTRHRYAEARHAFETAHQAVQHMRQDVQRDQAKRQLSAENADLYAHLVSCCLEMAQQDAIHQQEHILAAFVYTAVAKGRALVDSLATGAFDLLQVGTDDPQLGPALSRLRDLRQQIDNLRVQISAGGRPTMLLSSLNVPATPATTALETELRQLQTQEAALWEEFSFNYPALTATVQAPFLTIADAQQLAHDLAATLVEYYCHAEGWCAFVVSSDGVNYVPLPLIPEMSNKMIDWLLKMDSDLRTSPMLMNKPLYDWHAAAIAPLRAYLPAGGRVVLAPHWVLSHFPFSIVRDPQTGRYAYEDYQLAFAPSLSALWVMQQQAARSGSTSTNVPQHLLNIAYVHTPDHPRYIPGAVDANRTLVRSFASQVLPGLYDAAATPAAVVAAVRQQPPPAIIHITAHGGFDPELPEQSGLELAGGYLTVQRIISELPLQQTQLVTLAACLLGRASLERSGEAVGVTQAFLTAGAQAVVTALWEVEVNATLALFEAFYQRIRDGETPAVALRAAMTAIRATPGWEHPYYWAAWQVYGLAF
jgi:tetratricopeptide (TPR) repeat protein